MATYEKLKYNLPDFHEGNEADFEFEFDTNFPVEQIGEISFQCRDLTGKAVMNEKLMSTGGITLSERLVSVLFLPADTKGKSGSYRYEIDIINSSGNPFATIGGSLKINAEINTR